MSTQAYKRPYSSQLIGDLRQFNKATILVGFTNDMISDSPDRTGSIPFPKVSS